MLKEFGLTDTESEVYLFLSKYGASKGTEIAKQTKKDKAQIYNALKNLVTKGLAESTLESPVRYTPVAFESIVESAIKAKQEEAARIQNTKQELLEYWKKIKKQKNDLLIEKFVVIEGRQKIYSKISLMASQTKSQMSAITSVKELFLADQFGVYEKFPANPKTPPLEFRLLTELTKQNLSNIKSALELISKKGINISCRSNEYGQKTLPRMLIQDDQETLFFITPKPTPNTIDSDELCMWTNCKDIVKTFRGIFDELWLNSTDMEEKIAEIQTGIPTSKTCIITDSEIASKKYFEELKSAKGEICATLSSQGLIDFSQEIKLLWNNENQELKMRILAPITNENQTYAQLLMKDFEVRHIPLGYQESVIIDGKTFFEFGISVEKPGERQFKNTLFTNDVGQIRKNIAMFDYLWRTAQSPSTANLELASKPPNLAPKDDLSNDALPRTIKKMKDAEFIPDKQPIILTEKDVIDKMINAPAAIIDNVDKGVVMTYGVNCQAIVHPPKNLNLPDLLFHIYHLQKHSTFGAEDVLIIHPWLETPVGKAYVLSALLTDNPKAVDFWRKVNANSPAEHNVQLLEENELEVRVHGSTLFVGWTKPIRIFPTLEIPPSCLLIEGYGKLKTNSYSLVIPSGYKLKTEGNYFDAFVTFLHQSTKYSGPGTDGTFGREIIMEFYPPKYNKGLA
jgi:predicted transcriptional regulator